MKIGRTALLTALLTLAAPAIALGGTVRVPSTHGNVFTVYRRLHRGGLVIRLAQGQTFTSLAALQVGRSRPAAGRRVRAGSVVGLSLHCCGHARIPAWRGRSHEVLVPNLVGDPASAARPGWGVYLRDHVGRLDTGTRPGLLSNYVITRERPIGGSYVEILHGHSQRVIDIWATQILPPAYPCAPPVGSRLLASDAQAIVTEAGTGELFGCLRSDGRRFSLRVSGAGVALSGHWVALSTVSADGKYTTCSENVSTIDLRTRQDTPVYNDGCMAGVPGLPVAIDDLAVDDAGFAAWRTRSITADAVPLATISCPATSLCVAVDGQGNALTTASPLGGRNGWSRRGVGPHTGLVGIACPTTGMCVAIDGQGDAFTTIDPQDGTSAHWSAAMTGLTPKRPCRARQPACAWSPTSTARWPRRRTRLRRAVGGILGPV